MSNSNDKKKKAGSRRSPSLTLEAAVDKIKILWDKDGRSPQNIATLASHWSFSEKSSSLRGNIATMGYFGLLDQIGGSGSTEYRLSERSLTIMAGTGEDRAKAIRDAALEPTIYKHLWDFYKQDGGIPSDPNLKARLILHENVNPSSVDGFIKDFRATLAFAKLDNVIEHTGEDFSGDGIVGEDGGGNEPDPKNLQNPPPPPPKKTHLGTMIAECSVPLAGNQVTLSLIGDDPVLLEDIDDLDDLMMFLKKQLRKQIERAARSHSAAEKTTHQEE